MQSHTVKEVFAEDERRPGEARGLAHPIDVEFMGGRIDGEEAASLREAEAHCPVCLDVIKPRLFGKRCRHQAALPEDSIAAEAVDIDRKCFVEVDEAEKVIILHACTPEFARRKQDVGCIGIISVGQGLYDLIFPQDCVDTLMQGGF